MTMRIHSSVNVDLILGVEVLVRMENEERLIFNSRLLILQFNL